MATQNYSGTDSVNLGTGSEISIQTLVNLICQLMDFRGDVIWETNKPNGQPRRCLNVERAKTAFGFTAQVDLKVGLKKTIDWYLNQYL